MTSAVTAAEKSNLQQTELLDLGFHLAPYVIAGDYETVNGFISLLNEAERKIISDLVVYDGLTLPALASRELITHHNEFVAPFRFSEKPIPESISKQLTECSKNFGSIADHFPTKKVSISP